MARLRVQSQVNANNYCQSFNSCMKRELGKNHVLPYQLDRIISELLKFINDRVEEVTKFSTDSYSIKQLKDAHQRRVKENLSSHVRRDGDGLWIVSSRRQNTTYAVRLVNEEICCHMVCTVCRVCKHMFRCDYTLLPIVKEFSKQTRSMCK